MHSIQKNRNPEKAYPVFGRLLFSLSLCLLLSCEAPTTKGDEKTPLEEGKSPLANKLNAFVDISHNTMKVDLVVAQKAGLVGFFHKATQGINFADPKYGDRVQEGRKLNLLIGAYHFGTGEDVEKQVDAFLTVIKKYGSQEVVPVLDWERNPNAEEGTMSKKQASDFIELFFQKTKVYPIIYGGYWMLDQLRDEVDIESFAKAPLWQGFYSATFGYLDGIWQDWSFIQYTDGRLGPEPHEMEGIGSVDRDFFNGTLEEVKDFWSKNALKNNF